KGQDGISVEPRQRNMEREVENHQKKSLFSHCSGGQKSKIEVSAGHHAPPEAPGENSSLPSPASSGSRLGHSQLTVY
uniref:Uncharacterized protein n=1 Tax=Sus scrofa TaxID=9823 RepID=A0A8D1C1A4_PIG